MYGYSDDNDTQILMTGCNYAQFESEFGVSEGEITVEH